jgi:hypothetical protein
MNLQNCADGIWSNNGRPAITIASIYNNTNIALQQECMITRKFNRLVDLYQL